MAVVGGTVVTVLVSFSAVVVGGSVRVVVSVVVDSRAVEEGPLEVQPVG